LPYPFKRFIILKIKKILGGLMKKAGKNIFPAVDPFMAACFSLLLAGLGQYFLYTRHSLAAGLIILFISAGIFMFAGRNTPVPDQKLDKKIEIILFALIMLIAAFFRFYRINDIPAGCFVDEAQNVFDSSDITRGNLPVYFGFSTHNAALFLYPTAFIFRLFGAGVTELRATAALFGFLTVPALYFLFRSALGARAAVIAGFILAVLRWHVNFNRIGYHASLALLLFVLILYFLYRAYKHRSWPYFILLGACLGISQNTYQSARLIPFWLAFMSFFVFLKDRAFFTRNARKIAVSICIAVIISLPIIGYAVKNPAVFFQRQKEVSIFTKGIIEETYANKVKLKPWQFMFINIKDTLLMFNYAGDKNPKHNIPGKPGLDFILGIFVFLGFFRALASAKRPLYSFFLSIFAVFIIPGFITIEAPQSLRLFFLIPCVIFFAVVFVSDFLSMAENSGKSPLAKAVIRGSAAGAVAVLLLASGLNNYSLYFRVQAVNPFCWNDFATDAWEIGRYFKSKGSGWLPIVAIESYKERTFTLASGLNKRSGARRFKIDEAVPPAGYSGPANYMYLLTPQYNSLVEGYFKIIYPAGRYVPFFNKYDKKWKLYYAYEAGSADIEKSKGLFKNNGLRLKRYPVKDWLNEPYSETIAPVVMLDPDYGAISYEWTGKIKIPKKGEYVFTYDTKGRADLYLDGKLVLEAPGSEKGVNPISARVFLSAGYHAIKARYSQDLTFAKMELRWQVPGEDKEHLVPFDALFH
jgi:4-amino-4-deoxy-L-arabinose transferase-like glycosyltransferase